MEISKPIHVTQIRYLSIDERNAYVIPLLEPLFAIPSHASYEERVQVFQLTMTLRRQFVACEVGSYVGGSTALLAAAASILNGHVHAVDTWQNQTVDGEPLRDTFEEFSRNTRTLRQHITTHRGFSYEVCDAVPSVDLLFIDGDHTYEGALRDLERYVPKLVPGGLLLIHDFLRPEVQRAAAEFLRDKLMRDMGITQSLQVFKTPGGVAEAAQ